MPTETAAVVAPEAEAEPRAEDPIAADPSAAEETLAPMDDAGPDAGIADGEKAAPAADMPATASAAPADILSEEEQSIRELLREMIQEELLGELGQRFSRNLRAVIRREVAVAIDDHLDRL